MSNLFRDRQIYILTLGLLAAMVSAAISGWGYWQVEERHERFEEARITLTENIGQLRLLDDKLTMSARLAASARSSAYEDKYKRGYDEAADEYVRVVEETLKLFPKSEARRKFQATKEPSDQLFELEADAFELAREGRDSEALELLEGSEYSRTQQQYTKGLDSTFAALQTEAAKQGQRLHRYEILLYGLASVILMIVLVAWALSVFAIVRRKRAEEEIKHLNKVLQRRSEEGTAELEAFKFALDQSAIVATTDVTGKITYVNEKFCEISKYSEEELLGHDHRIINSGFHSKEFIRNIWRTIARGHVWRGELRNRAKDGSIYWVDTTIVPFLNERGKPYQYVAIRSDITSRKEVEEALRQARDELEARVEERTSELAEANADLHRQIMERKRAEEETERAREIAEEASRAKSDFLANMSHEIRTPMNGVIGMTGLLMDTELSDQQREYTETIRASGDNLLTIINDILDFSKIEAGRMELENIDFDLRNTVEETVGLFAEVTYTKGLELASLIESGVPKALISDPGRLAQILNNLISNAVKFTEEGEVVLRVSLLEDRGEEALVRFEITDTGIGLTKEQRERLFEAFTQADASTTRRYGGTGLGLTISKQLVELMGGEIGVESQTGKGSTFWFEIPFRKQPDDVQRQAATTPRTDLRGIKVLVVDDNETNRKIVHEQISSWNMRNGMAGDGRSALRMLREAAGRGEPYDVAILDMHMPEMDGMDLARRIKTDPEISFVRLILLTSLGMRGEAREVRDAGISAYLTKPVRQSHLHDAVATVMGSPEQSEPREEEERLFVTRHSIRERGAASLARLLVAEDNPVNQKVAVRMLESIGYRADVAADGLEVVEALSRVPYAAVLMDVQMPEMDGYEATREIRRREKNLDSVKRGSNVRHTPIIAVTANALRGDREKALEAGMDDYITKPVNREKLKAVLELWVNEEGGAEISVIEDRGGFVGPMETGEHVDPEAMENLRELGGREMLSELAEMFLDGASTALDELKKAIERSDARTVEHVAHTLKGSSASMGAKRMAEICEELQDMGASGNLFLTPELLESLEAEFSQVRPALEAEIEGGRR